MSDFWKNKSVLVTGATGLVGAQLVKQLVHPGASVCCLIRDMNPQSELFRSGVISRVAVVNGDLADYATVLRSIDEYEVDTVFHLGAQTIVGSAYKNPLETFESNIRGTYNLLEACRVRESLVRRVVVASSDKAYGAVESLPYREEMPVSGKFPYDVSKSCTDLLSASYAATWNLPVVSCRCGNIFGGGDLNWSRLIPGTIRALLSGETPIIRSDGHYVRDYIYVDDAVAGYLLMAEQLESRSLSGEVFNFAPERPRTVLEVVDDLLKLTGHTHIQPQVLNRISAEIREQYLSSEKAKRILNWEPLVPWETALVKTIAWYRTYLDRPEHTSERKVESASQETDASSTFSPN